MIELLLIGIGTGNPEHLTLEAIRALNSADLVMIPRKGDEKADLAELRRSICAEVISSPSCRVVEFDLPRRDVTNPSYRAGVDDWHDAIADVWRRTIVDGVGTSGRVALLIWGDPALYDSSLRIAERLASSGLELAVRVVPGIMSLQVLTAAHAIALNAIGRPFVVTTGRRLREEGWPAAADTVVVMLDGECSFTTLAPADITIWWGAFLGMPEQIVESGPLEAVGPRIVAARAAARERHGWIMDCYLLRRGAG
ncbi:MAG: precorrin-6A synthase (deacetylating) [Rhizobiales bacterium]|nr:precorrin-6A synthase (deacetylating) [Hyphomicrobiales bacterium]